MALLPKLHLNRHTSRAIVHGPEEFGGLALPHLHTLQGVDKLKLFLGHLRLQDRTGHLIHIDMTYVQLLTGTSMLFLNQDPAKYEWVESGWLPSLWTFINRSKLTITYPLAWKPNLPREHDRTLMDYFVNKGLQNKTLESINICRLYLQVITLSNVVAANGQTILPSYKAGHRLSSRVSKLSWPVQGRPPNTEWKVWASHLDELEKYGRLIQPLGAWVAAPHQTWTEFMDGQSGNIYVINGETVKRYQPLISNVRTRSGIQCWFDTTAGVATHLLPEGMVPATIDHSRTAGSLASAVFRLNPLPVENSNLRQTMDSQQAKLYNAILQSEPIPYQEIGKSLLQGSLTISVSSSGRKESETYSGSWSFHNHITIYSRLNAVICKAKYRAELYALWEAIHVLLTTERELLASCGKKIFPAPEVTIAVSQKHIMHRIFTQIPIGVKDTVQPHYDLILEIRHLLLLCESRTKAIQVPGQSITIHPKSKYPSSTNQPHPMV